MATDQPAGVTIARIVRAHGRRGEVAAEILTDFPQRLTQLKSALLWDGNAAPRGVAVRSAWLTPRRRAGTGRAPQAIFHFEGSNSISDAEKLVGLEVQLPFADRMPLPGGSYYISDLTGCEVREKGGAAIGQVRDVQFTGEDVAGTPILIVDSPAGELLIPLAQEICVRIDTNAHEIDVVLPEGLRDLNE